MERLVELSCDISMFSGACCCLAVDLPSPQRPVQSPLPLPCQVIKAQVIKPNEALKLRARVDFTANGVQRTVGEEWLVTASGAYMPHVEEEVVGKVKARVLTEKVALHLEATKTFVDVFGKERKAGQQWYEIDCLVPLFLGIWALGHLGKLQTSVRFSVSDWYEAHPHWIS